MLPRDEAVEFSQPAEVLVRSRSRFPSFCLSPFFALFAVASSAGAQGLSLTELFHKGKEEFKVGSYRSSLATFEQLDQLSQQPEGRSSIPEPLADKVPAFFDPGYSADKSLTAWKMPSTTLAIRR